MLYSFNLISQKLMTDLEIRNKKDGLGRELVTQGAEINEQIENCLAKKKLEPCRYDLQKRSGELNGEL